MNCLNEKPVSSYFECDCTNCKEREAIVKWSPEYNNYNSSEENDADD